MSNENCGLMSMPSSIEEAVASIQAAETVPAGFVILIGPSGVPMMTYAGPKVAVVTVLDVTVIVVSVVSVVVTVVGVVTVSNIVVGVVTVSNIVVGVVSVVNSVVAVVTVTVVVAVAGQATVTVGWPGHNITDSLGESNNGRPKWVPMNACVVHS